LKKKKEGRRIGFGIAKGGKKGRKEKRGGSSDHGRVKET